MAADEAVAAGHDPAVGLRTAVHAADVAHVAGAAAGVGVGGRDRGVAGRDRRVAGRDWRVVAARDGCVGRGRRRIDPSRRDRSRTRTRRGEGEERIRIEANRARAWGAAIVPGCDRPTVRRPDRGRGRERVGVGMFRSCTSGTRPL